MDALPRRRPGAIQQFALDAPHLADGVDQEGAHPFSTEQQTRISSRPADVARHGGQGVEAVPRGRRRCGDAGGRNRQGHSLPLLVLL